MKIIKFIVDELPESCGMCEYFIYDTTTMVFEDGAKLYCLLAKRHLMTDCYDELKEQERPSWCPLEEHGKPPKQPDVIPLERIKWP